MCNNFVEHGFLEKKLRNSIKQVPEMDRNKLLQNRNQENEDLQIILVSTWCPKPKAIPS